MMEETAAPLIADEQVITKKQSKTGLIMIVLFLLGFALIYGITKYIAQLDVVDGQSMEPTLHQGQYLFINRLDYRFNQPKYGDVVAIQWGANGIVKRIEGLPSDTIQIKDGALYRNGKQIEEPYIKETMNGKFGPITVPKDSVFVLGDNRNESRDSRSFGPVAMEAIIGRADAVIYPFSQFQAQPFGPITKH